MFIYLTYLGETMNVIDYLQNELKIPPVNRNTDTTTNTITNTISTKCGNTANTIEAVPTNNQVQLKENLMEYYIKLGITLIIILLIF